MNTSADVSNLKFKHFRVSLLNSVSAGARGSERKLAIITITHEQAQ
jgi:hypothetical protein